MIVKNPAWDGVLHGFCDASESYKNADAKWVTQKHTADVVVLDSKDQCLENEIADAIVTSVPGAIVSVYTADCAPILFCDFENKIIGIAHAGWRGAVAGVLENTVKKMISLGARSVHASIGPTISKKNYEVKEDFINDVTSSDKNTKDFISEQNGKTYFDLPSYIESRLYHVCKEIYNCNRCTFDGNFHSVRRFNESLYNDSATKNGRNVSFIGTFF